MKKFKFERTPIMSTYLLAFVIGEYDYIEEKDSNGVLIRVYTPLGKQEQGKFALEVSALTNRDQANQPHASHTQTEITAT